MTEDEYEKHAGDFKNEADLEEEMDEDGISVNEAEEEHFEEDEGKNY